MPYSYLMSNRNQRKSGKNRREQTPKAGNAAYMRGMQELRRSNAAGIHAVSSTRKPKYPTDYSKEF